MSGFEKTRLGRLHDAMAEHVELGNAGGLAWLTARDGDVEIGVAGTLTRGEGRAISRDSIFRLSSMTKPMSAVAALILVEECRLRLDEPVDDLLPELAGRNVLVDGRGPFDGETMPATRSITVRDVLTFQLGIGMDFSAPWPWPLMEAMADLGLGAGPPEPQGPPEPDEWIRRLSTLPLQYQPGEKWLYNVGSMVLGVLIARARRSAARRVHARAAVRTARHARHGVLHRAGRPARHLLRRRPGHRGADGLRRSATVSGRSLRRFPTRRPAWSRRSTTCTRSLACCSPRDSCPTDRDSSREQRSRR